MEFRLATLTDVDALEQMELEYLECGYSARVLTDTINDEQSKIILLTDGEKIIGYGGYKIIFDTADVYNIVVRQEYRRKGYAKSILQKLITTAKDSGVNQIFLEVNQHNTSAINLYSLFDFKQIAIRKNYYKSGDALILKKIL